MKLFKLYVGHDNKTLKRFEELTLKRLINKYFDAFTLIKSEGCYKLTSEQSYIIELITSETKQVNKLKSDLLTVLKQESILMTRTDLNQVQF